MVGKRLKKVRLEKGYSLSRLAEESGVSKSYLSYLERGLRTNPSLQVLTKIAQTLGCTLEYLLGELIMDQKKLVDVDDELVTVIKNAFNEDLHKVDLEEFREYIKFLNWKATNKS
ncbi:helix-turn-helix domain-containing protein [Ornithinibacillus halophilus]|nr:helix-turn-helix transcriptional regulator [Ornithinibacillus halophilus]